jgi:hypothetical protein
LGGHWAIIFTKHPVTLPGTDSSGLFGDDRDLFDDFNLHLPFDCGSGNQQQPRAVHFPGIASSFLDDCIVAVAEDATHVAKDTQKSVMTFKMNQTSECQDKIQVRIRFPKSSNS